MQRVTRPIRLRGFTLMELVISLAASAVLLAGMASAIMIASRALPGSEQELDAEVQALLALEQLATEIAGAIAVPERTARALTLIVPDRNDDSHDEVIRYTWDGQTGSPLLRTYNGGKARAVLTRLGAFTFRYEVQTIQLAELSLEETQSAELSLAAVDTTHSLADQDIAVNRWHGQFFRPTFVDVSNVESWRLSRIFLRVRRSGWATGESWVEVFRADAQNRPTGAVLARGRLEEYGLTSSFVWREVPLTMTAELAPWEGVCIVVRPRLNSPTGRLRYTTQQQATPVVTRLWSDTGGYTWQAYSGESLLFVARGWVTTLEPAAPTTRQKLVRIGVLVQLEGMTRPVVEVAFPLLNPPEVGL